MRTVLTIGLWVALVLSFGCSTPHKSDSAVLQGIWTGSEAGGSAESVYSLVISGRNLQFRGSNENEWYRGTFTLHPDQDPVQLVAEITECSFPQYIGKNANAIYRVDEGVLTLTGNEPGNPEVPTDFEVPGSRTFVLRKH